MTDKPRDNKAFWNLYARLYDFEIKLFSGRAYGEMARMMAQVLAPHMEVLEVATGTGLIALQIAPYVRKVYATDFAPKMIKKAQAKRVPANVTFSVEDVLRLPFGDNTFDAAIISNALHIMPDPVGALDSLSRVLKPGGLLIAPTYSHGHISAASWDLNARFLKRIGLETYSKWSPEAYVQFIGQNGFRVERWKTLQAAFPLVYLEAWKQKP